MIGSEKLSVYEVEQIAIPDFSKEKEDKKFVPRGAIAFFLVLMALCLAIWFGIYFLMLSRV